jgi:hypothetical protein
MTVDAERASVYAAEVAAFDGTDLEEVIGLRAVLERIEQVTAGEWWPGPPVAVTGARRDARSSSTRCDAGTHAAEATIRLAADQTTLATAAHELAHALAGPAHGHGPLFRVAYLDVVAVLTNADPTDRRYDLHVTQLGAAFADAGLAVGERRWPPPPEPAAIAL